MAEQYFVPKKEVSSLMDMQTWEESEIVKNFVDMLEKIDKWIDEIPPIEQPQRFGNKAFKTFYSKLKNEADSMLKKVLPLELHPAIVELSVYLVESVGNSTRIDYGTGHEMLFAMLLLCLFKIGAFKERDAVEVILKVFDRYLTLMRKLQVTYRMEPAGSQGGLDDYQYLPFIWGSSQLIGNLDLQPGTEDIDESIASNFMFMSCMKFINQVNQDSQKPGQFAEHSKTLWMLIGGGAGGLSWLQINNALKMRYRHEVILNDAAVQQVLFGSILPIEKHGEKQSMFKFTWF